VSERAQKVIGVSMLTMGVQFHRDLKAGLEKAAGEAGYALKLSVAEYRVADQAVLVARLTARKLVDAIVLTPCDCATVGIPIEQANRAGIPVFTLDIGNTSNRGKVLSHVASDNLAGGRKAGQLMVEVLGGRGKVVVVVLPGMTSMLDRLRGFKEAIAGAKGIEIVGELPVWADPRKESAALLGQMMRRFQVDGIFCTNDEFAMGAVAAVEAAGKVGQVKIIGYDGTEEVRGEIERGRIHGEVVQHPVEMATLVMRAVQDHFAGRPVPSYIPAEVTVRTSANARATR
jgi:ribose transport system substrate-binding protein